MKEALVIVACTWKCGVCRAVCAEDAVDRLPEGIGIDRRACSECLACARSCPAGLIGDDRFD